MVPFVFPASPTPPALSVCLPLSVCPTLSVCLFSAPSLSCSLPACLYLHFSVSHLLFTSLSVPSLSAPSVSSSFSSRLSLPLRPLVPPGSERQGLILSDSARWESLFTEGSYDILVSFGPSLDRMKRPPSLGTGCHSLLPLPG